MEISYHCSLGSFHPETTLPNRLKWISNSGFQGAEGSLPDFRSIPELKMRVADLGLHYGVALYLPESTDPRPLFEQSLLLGAPYIEAQVDGYGQSTEWIDARIQTLQLLSLEFKIPFFLETHRGRFTQDLLSTLELLDRHPSLDLCADLSHYVVCGEIKTPWSTITQNRFQRILNRSGIYHLRVNGGQRVQDPLDLVAPDQLAEFIKTWKSGIHEAKLNGRNQLWITTEVLYSDYLYTGFNHSPIQSTLQDSLRLKNEVGFI